jgi:RNA polymerase sigma-70 factor (TIGR02943 family)
MTALLSPENWVKNYADYFYAYAFFKTNNTEVAQDLVQDTFLAALRAKDGFKGDSNEKTWLMRILNNKIIDYYRAKKQHEPFEDYLAATNDSFHDTFFDAKETGRWTEKIMPVHYANTTDDYLQQQEFQTILNGCLQKLPLKLRQIFTDKYIDDRPANDICKEYDLSSSNYWVILHRSKVLLRSCLDKNY